VAGTGGKREGEKLRRLPPGRHGLSREFVAQNQRERLIAGTIAAVAEHGYRETTVTQVAAAAGVSRRTFYAYFKTKEECFGATFDLLEEHLFATLEEDRPGERSWGAQVRGRVSALLAVFGANPDLVRFALVAPPAAGAGVVMQRSRRLLERIVAALIEGAPEGGGYSAATAVEREAMAGALAAVLAARVEAGQEKLEGAFPELVELVLVPFLGRRRAMAEAQKG
jgi:AcrR family transcriptional regulator